MNAFEFLMKSFEILKKAEVLQKNFDFVRSRSEPEPVTFFTGSGSFKIFEKKHRLRLRLRIPGQKYLERNTKLQMQAMRCMLC